MDRIDTIQLMANYNQWMNQRMYEVASSLPSSELTIDRKAFFGSILGTLNHLAVGDTIWLKRFAEHPAKYSALDPVLALPRPTALDQTLFHEWEQLSAYRKMLDNIIVEWVKTISEDELDHTLEYKNTKGVAARKNFFALLMHFFNHQTHHRGQASALLAQAGGDVGVTDLLALIQNENA